MQILTIFAKRRKLWVKILWLCLKLEKTFCKTAHKNNYNNWVLASLLKLDLGASLSRCVFSCHKKLYKPNAEHLGHIIKRYLMYFKPRQAEHYNFFWKLEFTIVEIHHIQKFLDHYSGKFSKTWPDNISWRHFKFTII